MSPFDDAQDVSVAVGAVFDGHGGKEASKMASEKFLDYFFLHVVFNTYKKLFLHKKDNEEIDIRSFTRKRFEPKLGIRSFINCNSSPLLARRVYFPNKSTRPTLV